MAQLPTVDDVARVAGVSRQTVSNVLNTPDDRAARDPRARRRPRSPSSATGRTLAPAGCARGSRRRSASASTRCAERHLGLGARPLPARAHRAGRRARHAHHALHRAATPTTRSTSSAGCATAPTSTRSCSPRPQYDDPRIELAHRAAACPFVDLRPPVGRRRHGRPRAPLGRRRRRRRHARRDRAPHRPRPARASATSAGRPAPAPATTAAAAGTRRCASSFGRRRELADLIDRDRGGRARRARRWSSGCSTGGAPASTPSSARSDSLALGAMMAVREAGHPHFPVIGFDNTPVAQAVGLSSVDQRLDAGRRGRPRAAHGRDRSSRAARTGRTGDAAATASSPPSLSCAGRVTWRPSRKPEAPAARRSQSKGTAMRNTERGRAVVAAAALGRSPRRLLGGGGGDGDGDSGQDAHAS